MADELRAFSPRDYELFQRLVDDYRQRLQRKEVDSPDAPTMQSNDVYIAKVKDDEYLPARDGESPGKQECDIYLLTLNELTDVAVIEDVFPEEPFREIVYNIYDKGIPPCFYFRVVRDAYGHWTADNVAFQPYALVDCRRRRTNVYVLNDLAAQLGRITKWDGSCWEIQCASYTQANSSANSPGFLPLTEFYDDCSACKSCWKLTPCTGTGPILYTNSNLADRVGKVVKDATTEICYTVSRADNCVNAVPFTYYDYYETCTPCLDYCYHLVNCYNVADTLVVLNDLARIVSKTAEEVVSEGWVFNIDGKCYRATAYNTTCGSAVSKTISNYYSSCVSCGCFKLTPCAGTGAPIYARGATKDSASLDFRELLNGLPDADPPVDPTPYVRLDDGDCYLIEVAADCETSTDVVVLETYKTCDDCKCYTLTACVGGTSTTYTDLVSLGFSVGQIIKLDDDTCHTITNDTAVFAGAVEVTPKDEAPFPSCASCNSEIPYELVASGCVHPDCEEAGADPLPDIRTYVDLHDKVGLHVKHLGGCYIVSEGTGTAPASGDDGLTRDVSSYPTCEDCTAAESTWDQQVVTDVSWDGTDLKQKKKTVKMTGTSACEKTSIINTTDPQC